MINILSVLFGNEVIKYFNLEEKFPRLKNIINYYKKGSLLFIIIDVSVE